MREVGASPDGIEGATAFVEKRAPDWAAPTDRPFWRHKTRPDGLDAKTVDGPGRYWE